MSNESSEFNAKEWIASLEQSQKTYLRGWFELFRGVVWGVCAGLFLIAIYLEFRLNDPNKHIISETLLFFVVIGASTPFSFFEKNIFGESTIAELKLSKKVSLRSAGKLFLFSIGFLGVSELTIGLL